MIIRLKRILLPVLVPICTLMGCTPNREGLTVDSAFMYPIPTVPPYSFSRNGYSSVNTLEVELLRDAFNEIHIRLERSLLDNDKLVRDLMDTYQGKYSSVHPRTTISTSRIHADESPRLQAKADSILMLAAVTKGYGAPDPSLLRRRSAEPGVSGSVGWSFVDNNKFYVDAKGVRLSYLFEGIVMGTVYLDRMMCTHLDESTLMNQEIRMKHVQGELLVGHNFTHLEHSWDLGYGYFRPWHTELSRDPSPLVGECLAQIEIALAQGRIDLHYRDFTHFEEQLTIIRREMSRAVVIHVMRLLAGEQTLANLREDPRQAFSNLSSACGLIHALPYLRSPEGAPYFSHAMVDMWVGKLLEGNGLWEKERLQSGIEVPGSLLHIASEIGKPLGITLHQLKI